MTRVTSRPIAGLVVAITGGARGIGAAIAEELAGRGALVGLGDVDELAARATAERLGKPAIGLPLDVTDEASFASFLEAVAEAHGRPVDVLVNNAGVMWVGPYADEPDVARRKQFEVNVFGVVRGLRLALPAMVDRGHGHVVTIASAASKVTPAGEASYAATKHAVHGYVSAVREEIRGSGVDLTLVMPVVVETELAAGTAHGRTKRLHPADVAKAVAGAIEKPRFEVFVPREVGLLVRLNAVLPQVLRDLLARLMVPDQVRSTDPEKRAAYERRHVS